MPLFSREKSSLKGRWRLETVQDMRSSSSNPVSCSETSIKIYGSKEEIRAQKSPETVDAPGFAPDASIPVILYGPSDRIRTCGILLPKQARYQLRYTRLFRYFIRLVVFSQSKRATNCATPRNIYFYLRCNPLRLALLARLAVPKKILALFACSIFSTAERVV